jgi:hypothetical protein
MYNISEIVANNNVFCIIFDENINMVKVTYKRTATSTYLYFIIICHKLSGMNRVRLTVIKHNETNVHDQCLYPS